MDQLISAKLSSSKINQFNLISPHLSSEELWLDPNRSALFCSIQWISVQLSSIKMRWDMIRSDQIHLISAKWCSIHLSKTQLNSSHLISAQLGWIKQFQLISPCLTLSHLNSAHIILAKLSSRKLISAHVSSAHVSSAHVSSAHVSSAQHSW